MAAQGITIATLLFALAALTQAADTTPKNDPRLFSDSNTSVSIGSESLLYLVIIIVGLVLVLPFLGLFETSKAAQPYDYSASAYAAPAPAYDEKSTFKVHQVIEDAINKFQ
ncbi:uncharacterized protein LOC122249129 isoform X1 [Penaeus japonicus]|uniref:uncharacterized protein LOC122249128 n=1 Tax=Penaeus japonicus TaxID=27405 RepID=UPI001C70D8A8|nr:uncharacterized protein LOC122249128 [Penaeus japonicus]XP_042865681.1 uncharacterized protein LOC122249129 isoform X1 [Penaeus japonicus]